MCTIDSGLSVRILRVNAVIYSYTCLPALVAHLDARLAGEQEVKGSTPAGLATFFLGDCS